MTTATADFATNELGEILSIAEAARRAKWARRRMWRHLIALNRELGGLLLVNVARGKIRPRWTVSVAALKLVHPQWFQDPDGLQHQLDALRDESRETRIRVARLERTTTAHEQQLAALRATG